MNRIVIVGRVAFDPELKETPNGLHSVKLKLGEKLGISKEGEPLYQNYTAELWGKAADQCVEEVSKGASVMVSGISAEERTCCALRGDKVRVMSVSLSGNATSGER